MQIGANKPKRKLVLIGGASILCLAAIGVWIANDARLDLEEYL
jgi:hypothetical protein